MKKILGMALAIIMSISLAVPSMAVNNNAKIRQDKDQIKRIKSYRVIKGVDKNNRIIYKNKILNFTTDKVKSY